MRTPDQWHKAIRAALGWLDSYTGSDANTLKGIHLMGAVQRFYPTEMTMLRNDPVQWLPEDSQRPARALFDLLAVLASVNAEHEESGGTGRPQWGVLDRRAIKSIGAGLGDPGHGHACTPVEPMLVSDLPPTLKALVNVRPALDGEEMRCRLPFTAFAAMLRWMRSSALGDRFARRGNATPGTKKPPTPVFSDDAEFNELPHPFIDWSSEYPEWRFGLPDTQFSVPALGMCTKMVIPIDIGINCLRMRFSFGRAPTAGTRPNVTLPSYFVNSYQSIVLLRGCQIRVGADMVHSTLRVTGDRLGYYASGVIGSSELPDAIKNVMETEGYYETDAVGCRDIFASLMT